MRLLYSCLFGYIFFFVSRAHRHILTVKFFITSYPRSFVPSTSLSSLLLTHKKSLWFTLFKVIHLKNKISRSPPKSKKKKKIMFWIVMWLDSKIWAKWSNVMNYLGIHFKLHEKKKKRKKIYDKFMLWHQCKPLQCEVFPLREALMLASSLTPITACYFT